MKTTTSPTSKITKKWQKIADAEFQAMDNSARADWEELRERVK